MPDHTVPHKNRCPICLGNKPAALSLCGTCLGTYGRSASDWPGWVSVIVNDEARWLYDERQIDAYEVCLDDFEPDDDEELEDDASAPSGSDSGYGLPYAPYADEDMNRIYRRVHKISSHKPSERGLSPVKHYDAHNPNLPEGWWEAGRWVKPAPTLGETAKEA